MPRHGWFFNTILSFFCSNLQVSRLFFTWKLYFETFYVHHGEKKKKKNTGFIRRTQKPAGAVRDYTLPPINTAVGHPWYHHSSHNTWGNTLYPPQIKAQYALSKCTPLKDKSYESYESYLRIACTCCTSAAVLRSREWLSGAWLLLKNLPAARFLQPRTLRGGIAVFL